MLSPATVLSGLPPSLRAELLLAYEAISQNYVERKWEPSELNGGKFCEIAYCIIQGAINGSMPTKAKKPSNMVQACRELEKIPANTALVGDRSFRVLIPRALLAISEIRNNRNVGHVGGDVNPNYLDATVVHSIANWILAELIRIFHNLPIQEAQNFVDAITERRHPLVWLVGDNLRVLDTSLDVKDQALLLLHSKSGWVLTKDLIGWVEYSNPSKFRSDILGKLHKQRIIEFDKTQDRVLLSPLGVKDVEIRILGAARI